jgi:hypothetical protein
VNNKGRWHKPWRRSVELPCLPARRFLRFPFLGKLAGSWEAVARFPVFMRRLSKSEGRCLTELRPVGEVAPGYQAVRDVLSCAVAKSYRPRHLVPAAGLARTRLFCPRCSSALPALKTKAIVLGNQTVYGLVTVVPKEVREFPEVR